MITLTFSPLGVGSQVLVRAAFFRIGPDSTLRDPESTLVATYMGHTWRLGARRCREFHCNDFLYLRVTTLEGEHLRHGPYQFVRAAEGALFVNGTCLGTYAAQRGAERADQRWHEITLLSAAGAMT